MRPTTRGFCGFRDKVIAEDRHESRELDSQNAMKCIHWTISEIEEHHSEIEPKNSGMKIRQLQILINE